MQIFKPIGKCIYCGVTDCKLSDEHIIPYALNGSLVLPKSSCDKCADITKKFEQTISRPMYGVVRVKGGFKTRRKKERPTHFTAATIDEQGIKENKELLTEDYPTTYLTVDLPLPGIITGAPKSNKSPEMKINLVANKDEIGRAISSYEGSNILLTNNFAWGDFCRLLAKIAHCYLIAIIGENGYKPLLTDIILGNKSELSHYVGGVSNPISEGINSSELSIAFQNHGNKDYLVVYINILNGRLPTYQVVAGIVYDKNIVLSDLTQRE